MIPFLPTSRYHVEALTPRDADVLAEIHREGFPSPWLAADFASLVGGDNVGALGLRRDSAFGFSRHVGFILFRTAGDEAEILTIAVRNAQRGRGHGRLLMEEALRQLYRDRVQSCFLEVDPGNAAALALYGRLGFRQVGSRKGYYARPGSESAAALVMRLDLQ